MHADVTPVNQQPGRSSDDTDNSSPDKPETTNRLRMYRTRVLLIVFVALVIGIVVAVVVPMRLSRGKDNKAPNGTPSSSLPSFPSSSPSVTMKHPETLFAENGGTTNTDFGRSVVIMNHPDANDLWIAVGLAGYNQTNGSVRVVEATSRNQVGQTLFGTIPNDEFGIRIESSNDGRWLVVTGWQSVRMYTFDMTANRWIQVGRTIGTDSGDFSSLSSGSSPWHIEQVSITSTNAPIKTAPNATSVLYITVYAKTDSPIDELVDVFFLPLSDDNGLVHTEDWSEVVSFVRRDMDRISFLLSGVIMVDSFGEEVVILQQYLFPGNGISAVAYKFVDQNQTWTIVNNYFISRNIVSPYMSAAYNSDSKLGVYLLEFEVCMIAFDNAIAASSQSCVSGQELVAVLVNAIAVSPDGRWVVRSWTYQSAFRSDIVTWIYKRSPSDGTWVQHGDVLNTVIDTPEQAENTIALSIHSTNDNTALLAIGVTFDPEVNFPGRVEFLNIE